MKKILLLISSIILYLNTFSAIDVYLMYALYNSPQGPYVETYMSSIGESLVFKQTSGNTYQAEIEVLMLFKKGNEIVDMDKYNLKSPEINDTLSFKPNFIDVQRTYLPVGIYNFEIQVKDINSTQAASVYSDIIKVEFNNDKISFGGIQFLESISPTKEESILSKNGYDLIPYVSSFFPTNVDKISFYIEMYNTDNVINDDFVLRYYIENYETSKEIDKYSRFKKMTASSIIPYIGEMSIKDLPSGNYNLVFEIRNRENQSIEKAKYFFQRSNLNNSYDAEIEELAKNFDIYSTFTADMTSRDSLAYYISTLRPIANLNERRFIDHQVKGSSLEALQNFFMQFWVSRNNVTPNELWKEYSLQVQYVDKLYRTKIRRGYETDMGIIYLKYGAPNEIYSSKHEPSSYPYEIWTFWKAGKETNRKFVFYNPNLVGSEYELLHSNATGEIKTQNWDRLLQKRNNTLYDFDEVAADDSWGSRALEEFNK